MGKAADRLLAYLRRDDAYTVPHADVRAHQIAAMDERLQENVGRIALLGMRAKSAGIARIERLEDMVPLLFPHTAYKSYPESVLIEKKWDKLTRWLGTVAANPIENVDLDRIGDIDEWLLRLERAGHYVSCTSGTTGKSAMLPLTRTDLDWCYEDSVRAVAWCSRIAPSADRRVFRLSPIIRSVKNVGIGAALEKAYGKPGVPAFDLPVPPITIGSITRMVALRKAIAEGTAKPSELGEYEATSAARQKAVDDSIARSAEALIAARGERLFIVGMWASLYQIAAEVRRCGYSGADFAPGNTSYIAGGLKGAKLPDNYKEVIYGTFNMDPDRNFQMYGMQEINSSIPRCREAGRYHVPPWLICLPLDKTGDSLAPIGDGEVEGRAAFFDLSTQGRWGGIISGDRIHVDFSPCRCGAQTPSIRDDVIRYADLEGDDKISCAGTVDAYVKGLS